MIYRFANLLTCCYSFCHQCVHEGFMQLLPVFAHGLIRVDIGNDTMARPPHSFEINEG